MKLNDILESGLIKDDDTIKLVIHDEDSVLRETWRGNWYEDGILSHGNLEVIQILFDNEHGWQIFLRR